MHFEDDPYTAVAMFRMMAGIPADPRICPDDLSFNVDTTAIINRFSETTGHAAPIKTCGACGIRDVMVEGEYRVIPLSHKKISVLECTQEKLETLTMERRHSMNLVVFEEVTYHLDSYAVDIDEGTVIVCASCFTSLAYAIRTNKPPIQTLAFYDYGIIPASLPKLSWAERIAYLC